MRIPKGLAALFAVLMLAVCAVLAWSVMDRSRLEATIADTQTMLDTSRQRELKQQYEYDKAATDLPAAQATLSELTPRAQAAQAAEQTLRETRKTARAASAELTAAAEEAAAGRAAQEEALRSLTLEPVPELEADLEAARALLTAGAPQTPLPARE